MIGDFIKLVFTLIMLAWGLTVASGCRLMTAEEMGLVKPDDSLVVSKSIFGARLEVHSRKDTSMHNTLSKLTYDKTTGAFNMEGLDSNYVGNASEVMKANIGQLEKMGPIVDSYAKYEEARGKTIALGIQAGGELGAKIIGAAIQPLLGASVGVDGILGKGNINLGGSPKPTTTQSAEVDTPDPNPSPKNYTPSWEHPVPKRLVAAN